MTPADLRAIAARVMAGEADDGDETLRKSIAHVAGWKRQRTGMGLMWECPMTGAHHHYAPDFLHSLDAADLLMAQLRERGWLVSVDDMGGSWTVSATIPTDPSDPYQCLEGAPTEPRARAALALLCRAAELENEK